MFSKFLVVVLTITAALAGASKQLRSHGKEESVTNHHELPIDNVRGRDTVKRFQQKARRSRKLKMDSMSATNHLKTVRTSVKDKVEAAFHHHHATSKSDKRQLSHEQKDKFDISTIQITGWAQERIRPNRDCSGTVIEVGAIKMGQCQNWMNGQSAALGCLGTMEGDEEITALAFALYNGHGCTGAPLDFVDTDLPHYSEQCVMKVDDFNFTGPVMAGYHCTQNTAALEEEKPSYLQTSHWDSSCGDEPHSYSAYRLGACQLDMVFDNDYEWVNENTEFQYVKYIACSNMKGEFEMVTYSDSLCHRPMYRSVMSFNEDDDGFKTCFMEEDDGDTYYEYGICSDSAEGYRAPIVE